MEEIARRVGEVRRGKSVVTRLSQTQARDSHSGEGTDDSEASAEDRDGVDKGSEREGSFADGELGLDPSLLSACPSFRSTRYQALKSGHCPLAGHVLRLLATHHVTKEVRPDVFANNRISSAMDSGKSIEELMSA